MENNLVRTADLLGSKKNIIGNGKTDLVLEALGKVYVKTGKLTRVLNDVFKLLDGINSSNASSKTIITKNIQSIKYPGDGYLVFDSSENALYISYDERYLLVVDGIDKAIKDLGYVKKEGDSMYGPLEITHRGAPLIVASSQLVKNFNANYLEGHKSEYFAAKSLDEFISGSWTFKNDAQFEKNVKIQENIAIGGDTTIGGELAVSGQSEFESNARFRENVSVNGDITLNGSIGSPMFMSGYQGYGWRFDANTNMLTVDYLVVRKAMHVFELVVNKISATNGSLWVTDSAKIDSVYNVKTLPIDAVDLSAVEEDTWYIPYKTNERAEEEGEEDLQIINRGYNSYRVEINDKFIKRPEEYNIVDGVETLSTQKYDIFKCINKYKSLDVLIDSDPFSSQNIDKSVILFPDSELDGSNVTLTHFEREEGFGFPLNEETPIFVYENTPSYRLILYHLENLKKLENLENVPEFSCTYYKYNTESEDYTEIDDNYNDPYAYIKIELYTKTTLNGEYRFNTVTKEYIPKPSGLLSEHELSKYIYNLESKYVKVLYKKGFKEIPTHFKTSDGKYLPAKPTHRENNANVLLYLLQSEPTHYWDSTTNTYKEADDLHQATHTKDGYACYVTSYRNSETEETVDIDKSNATHYLNSETSIYELYQLYVPAVAAQYYQYSENGETKYEFTEDFSEATHYMNENGEYIAKEDGGATHIYDSESDMYVPVTTPFYVLSNYRLALGEAEATHVYVPESYFAEASNVYVATHYHEQNDLKVIIEPGNYVYVDADGDNVKDENESVTAGESSGQYLTLELVNLLYPSITSNRMLNPITTPRVICVDRNLKNTKDIKQLCSLYKYFGIPNNDDVWDNATIVNLNNVKVIKMKDDEYPPFKEGDTLRCLKFENGNIKFYEAVVACKIDAYSYVIIIAGSVFDKQTTIEYNDDGSVKEYKEELNTTLYSKTSQTDSNAEESVVGKEGFNETSLIAEPASEDGLVRIGNLYDRDRQNSVYITSSEMNSPYIQTISEVNRPDYTVLYGSPNFETNNLGYYKFSTNDFETSNAIVSVKTHNGTAEFECKDEYFYAPNNHYINKDGTITIAQTKDDTVKINANSRVRLGNLNGITDPMFGNTQPYGYGLFADNVFLKGEFYLNNGKTVVEFSKEQAKIESEKISLKATAKYDNLFYASDGDDYLEELPNPNLFRNTNFTKKNANGAFADWGYLTTPTVNAKSYKNLYNSIRLVSGSVINQSIASITKGDTYTVSCYCKGTKKEDATVKKVGFVLSVPYSDLILSSGDTGSGFGNIGNTNTDMYHVPTEDLWELCYTTFTYNPLENNTLSNVSLQVYNWGYDGEIACIKVERGNTVTPYCLNNFEAYLLDPILYADDFGKWYPVLGSLQKSDVIASDGLNYIKGVQDSRGVLNLMTISNKEVSLLKGQTICVLLDSLQDCSNNFALCLLYIKDGEVIHMMHGESYQYKSILLGVKLYTFKNFPESGEYFLVLQLQSITGHTLSEIHFKSEIASENRMGVEASITIENGEITQTLEDVNKDLSILTQTVEGFEYRVESVEDDVSIVKQTANEWSTLVGYSYVLFETPKLSIAKQNDWASSVGSGIWLMDADDYLKLFNKTETSETTHALGYGTILWRNSDSYVLAKSNNLKLYFKPPYEIKKNTKISIKLTLQDSVVQLFGFTINGVIKNKDNTILSDTASYDLKKDVNFCELKLELTLNIQENQIYNLHISSPSMSLFYLIYPINTNFDIFEGSQIQVLKDNINISTKELVLQNESGSTKLLSEQKDIQYYPSGLLKTTILMLGYYTLNSKFNIIYINYLNPNKCNINKYPYWMYYQSAKEIKSTAGGTYENSDGVWKDKSSNTLVEIGKYLISYFDALWGITVCSNYNVYYNYRLDSPKLAHFLKVSHSASSGMWEDFVSIYSISLLEIEDLNCEGVSLIGNVLFLNNLYYYDDENDEYKSANYFGYKIVESLDSAYTYSLLEFGVDDFETTYNNGIGVVSKYGNSINKEIISKLDGYSASHVMALTDTYSYTIGFIQIPTNSVYQSVKITMEKKDDITSTSFSLGSAMDNCNPANINYLQMLGKINTSQTVTSLKPYVPWVVAYDHTKYENNGPEFTLNYELNLKNKKSESYILPDKLWLEAKSGNALMAYDSDNGLRLIFEDKVINFTKDGITKQMYTNSLQTVNSEYKNATTGDYVKIIKISTTIEEATPIISW